MPEDDSDAPLRGLPGEMRTAEGELARAHAFVSDRIVIADGPLNIGESTPSRVVGFVKRLFKLYLPLELLGGDLPVPQRRLVEAWTELHRAELFEDWTLLQSGQPPVKIDPLT